MLIYTEHITPRLTYIVAELFKRRLGIDARLTVSVNEVEQYAGAKINYSHHTLEGCLHIKPHPILFDAELTNYNVLAKHHHEWDTLIWEQHGLVPFDIFAASFYLLTRYEEYLPHKVDDHGRFDPEQSLAVEYGFIETPLIDKWAILLKNVLEKQYGTIACTPPTYRFLSTFDIDTAYLYKGLENFRQLGKTIKSATLLRFDKLAEQVQVLHRNGQDPYDTYQYIETVTEGKPVLYFTLCGGQTEFDEALPIESVEMQELLKSLAKKYDMGIHPSYASQDDMEIIQRETALLEKCIEKKVTQSRQHFLRFTLPHTYQALIKLGITEEYSMGYAKVCGFRASTAHPFYFFDLTENTQTNLLVYPTTVMDVSLKLVMNLTVQSALQKVEQLIHEVKQVNGIFISLWHNSNLSETNEWLEWKEVFEKIHTEA
jgi:hypothetical protein